MNLMLRVMACDPEIPGNPGEQEIPGVVAPEQPQKRSPCGAFAADFQHGWYAAGSFMDQPLTFGHHQKPGDHPQKTQAAHGVEEYSPADLLHQEAAREKAERGAEFAAGIDGGVGKTSLLFVIASGQDFGIGGICHALAEAENQTQDQKHCEA